MKYFDEDLESINEAYTERLLQDGELTKAEARSNSRRAISKTRNYIDDDEDELFFEV